MIRFDTVSKIYDKKTALDNVSCQFESNQITGLLGPNGAGKTTLIRLMLGLLVPDYGSVTIDGIKPEIFDTKNFGYLPEERGLYKRAKVRDMIVYFGQLKGLTKKEASTRANRWLERLNLTSYARFECEELSKGLQQKVQWVTAILHDPKILILDEPFSGLDPIHQSEFFELLEEL